MATLATDLCLKGFCMSSILFHYTIVQKNVNVACMSCPDRYSYVVTLAQKVLKGLSFPTSKVMVVSCLPTTHIFIRDGKQLLL